MKIAIIVAAGLALSAAAAQAAPAPPAAPASPASEPKLMTIAQAREAYPGRLSGIVLDFLTVMDATVNKPKQPPITAADWAPLGRLVDQARFRRVGNFGVRNDWPSYVQLLTRWAGSNWWKGYVWRMREVPASPGQPALVYLETEERSNAKHPVRDDGDYNKLASIAVYEIAPDGRIARLHVYDQRPM